MSTAAAMYFSHTHSGINYVQIQNISTATAVLYGHVFPYDLPGMPVQELKKNSRVLVQPTESLELHTHRTIVDGEKKFTIVITPRCPDNRRELRVHATKVV